MFRLQSHSKYYFNVQKEHNLNSLYFQIKTNDEIFHLKS